PQPQQQNCEQRHRDEPERTDARVEGGPLEEVPLSDRNRLGDRTRPNENPSRPPTPVASPSRRDPLARGAKAHAPQRPNRALPAAMTPLHRVILSRVTKPIPRRRRPGGRRSVGR